MPTGAVSRRTLNRTLLTRQFLLERARTGPREVVRHLVGLQSQTPASPYPGLWSRLAGFRFDALGELLTSRRVVRITAMRATVHLMAAEDVHWLRPLLQPALDRAVESSRWARGAAGVDRAELAAAGREALAGGPLGPAELRAALGPRFPEADPESLVNLLRIRAPLVQVPPRGLWGAAGGPRYAFADDWLGAPPAQDPDPAGAVRRYLAAFGPASPADAQKWSGLTGLRRTFAAMDLRPVTTEDGAVLYDLPDAELADPDLAAPPRLVADFDNLLLSHADRARVLGDVPKERVITANGLVRGTLLLDGFVAGTWRFARTPGRAAVVLAPFAPLRPADRDTLTGQALDLLAASDPRAAPEVRVEPP
ncbi:winged helix DNA-binding domain-containing protein [Actinacidiphila yeochonensis]|uniref:winged helix DNA-binding domain-containing protein n=1 Tax=Actinacidiphila yeochonensis TaxID=89050 RepID=UPI0005657007|nr:winged helix DNA-binding domain-containing protein [Actinacidiphila yeochonensis]